MEKKPARQARLGSDEEVCKFCRFAGDRTGISVVFEDDVAIAFLDDKPLFKGHCQLIPKMHAELLADLPPEQVGRIFNDARMLSVAVKEATDSDGTFIAINNGVSQSVPHLHIHIVPRKHKDGLHGFFWPRMRYKSPEEEAEFRDKIRNAIDALKVEGKE